MIDFTLTDAEQNVRDMLRWFAESLIRPVSLQSDREHKFPDELLKQAAQMGLAGGSTMVTGGRKSMGGDADAAGAPKRLNRLGAIGSEQMAWGDAAFPISLPGPGLGGPPVRIMGTAEQQERFLKIFRDPDDLRYGAYGLTEPGAGSDVARIQTTCVKDGDHWILNGRKVFITNGGKADWVVIFATVDRRQGRQAHRAFVVEKGTPGFYVGKIEEKLGLRASETAELVLEDARVPADNLLGGEEHYHTQEGFLGAMKTFDQTRPLVASMAVGIGTAAYERARDFVKENYMLGRAIGRYRAIEEQLARSKRELDAARLMVWHAAWMADEGLPNVKEASMSKAYAAMVAERACGRAIDILGAAGIVHDEFVEKWYRDIKVYDIFEGTGQIQRVVISKRLIEGLREF